MNADRLLGTLGVDGVQWRALVRAYLVMDLRAGGGPQGPAARKRRISGGIPYLGLLVMTAGISLLIAVAAARIPDLLAAATMVTTYSAMNTAILLLVDFTAFVISPTDYAVLGHQPVSSRTYFAARVTSVLVYVGVVALVTAFFPALVFALWKALGIGVFAGVVASVVLCSIATAVVIINGYVLALNFVHPDRLRRATTILHLMAASLFYVGYYLATSDIPSMLQGLSFEDLPWLWANPASWFAAWIPVIAGTARGTEVLAAVSALTITVACVPLAAGRLSLDYSRRLGEMAATSQSRPGRRRIAWTLPGFRRHEGRAVAVLVRAQFRYDQRFRLAILAVLPMLLFYLLLGLDQGALVDPFDTERSRGGVPIYMAVVFMPMTLHSALHMTESSRAAWIFFATPASASRLVIAAKNYAAVYFLGGYLVLLAAVWSYFYDRVWHAVVHAAAIGMFAHLLLQCAVMISPHLPFATEPRQSEHSTRLFGLFFTGAMIAVFAVQGLPFVYARPKLAAIVFGSLTVGTVAMEILLRWRVEKAIGELEFV